MPEKIGSDVLGNKPRYALSLRQLEVKEQTSGGCTTLSLLRNTKKIGEASFCVDKKTKVAEVTNLHVEVPYRKHGYGKLLVRNMEKAARSRKAKKIVLESWSKHKPFYTNLGYRNIPLKDKPL